MNRISKNIAIALLSIVVWTVSEETYAQCRVNNNNATKGEFKINNIQVKGDGGGLATASNNIPIKICEGEVITLKNTILGTSPSITVGYWITEELPYLAAPIIPFDDRFATKKYNPSAGEVDVDAKMIDNDPQGFSSYSKPGRYVIYQYDTTPTGTIDPFHYACQVIEIIKPTIPSVEFNVCSGGQIITKFRSSADNIYDNYNIKYLLSPTYQPSDTTGKIASYPFDFKSITDLSGFVFAKVEVKGLSKTGGCPAPATVQQTFALNNTVINRPTFNAIVGTTQKGEFKLAITSDNGVKRNIYMHDPATTNAFDYSSVFKTYTSTNTTSLVDSFMVNVPDADKKFCFQVEAVGNDACSASNISNPNLRSLEEICTTPITVTPQNNKNIITWEKASGSVIGGQFRNYEIERFFPDGTKDKLLNSTRNPTDLSFTDSDVTCGREYVYRVTTFYPNKSISQSVKVKATSSETPPKIPFAFANISNTGTNVRVQGRFNVGAVPVNIKPDAYKYYRAESLGGNYTLLKSGNSFIDDITADIDKKSYCYYMTWTNLCNNESDPSEKICTVYLKSDGTTLKWTPETSLSVGTDSYLVQSVNPATKTNIKVLKDNLIGVHNFDTKTLDEGEGQELYIQIESRPIGWNTNDLPSTLSNIIRIFRPSFAMSPEIFTPNGDGNNDKFVVRGKFIKKLKMTIYDRWGNAIYYEDTDSFPLQKDQTDTNVVGWNGIMNNGNRAIEGSYAYKIEIEDTIGQVTTKEGALLLAY